MFKASSSDKLVPAGEDTTQSTERVLMSHGQLSLFQAIGAGLLLVGWGMLAVTGYVQLAATDATSQLAQTTTAGSDATLQQPLPGTSPIPSPTTSSQPAPLPGTTAGTPLPVLAAPTVQFSVAGGDISFAEILYVKPSRGTKVKAFIQNKAISLSTQLDLKQASPENLSWSFRLDNLNLPAGEYNFMAQVYAEDKWYEQKSEETFTIFINEPVDSGDEPATTDEPVDEEVVVQFPSLPSTLSAEQAVVMQLEGVERPQLIVRDRNKKVMLELMPMVGPVPPMYAFIIDTRRLPNGLYFLDLRYRVDGEQIVTNGPSVTVKNEVTAAGTASSSNTATTTIPNPNNFFEIVQLTDDPLARYQTFEFYGNDLSYIEVHLKNAAQTTPNLLGQAKRQDGNVWNYTIDTQSLPVGTYQLIAKYKRGTTVTTHPASPSFKVMKPTPLATSTAVTPTPDPIKETVKELEPIVKQATAEVVPVKPLATPAPKPALPPLDEKDTDIAQADADEPRPNVPRVVAPSAPKPVLENNQRAIDEAIGRYTTALRSGDEAAIKQARNAVLSLGVNLAFAEDGDIYGDTADILYGHLEELLDRAEKIEVLVSERTKEQISIDTDQDGITDFDEVTLYKTDPKNPDTDGDGFLDGAEILAGFDPLSAKAEVAVVFESPKESGVVRPDVFSVETVAPIVEVEPEADGVDAQAQITGKGLPNSFVTLFIFSTPVVVTLKTADDGSWVYKFDKELEDGEHEVYVGMTDNAGAIVAKSNPFRFVKEAQAFSPITDQSATIIEETAPRGIESPVWITAVASLIMLLVGLILLLLGKQFDRGRQTGALIQP